MFTDISIIVYGIILISLLWDVGSTDIELTYIKKDIEALKTNKLLDLQKDIKICKCKRRDNEA